MVLLVSGKDSIAMCCLPASVCVSTYTASHCEIDGGDVMSGIDPLNVAPSSHNPDVIHAHPEMKDKPSLYKFFGPHKKFNDLIRTR